MLHVDFVNKTKQSLSHNCFTAINAPLLRCGKICPVNAFDGMPGMFISAVCVDVMMVPFGS